MQDLDFADQIEIGLVGASAGLQASLEANREYICGETLATKLVFEALAGCQGVDCELGDEKITLLVRKVGGHG